MVASATRDNFCCVSGRGNGGSKLRELKNGTDRGGWFKRPNNSLGSKAGVTRGNLVVVFVSGEATAGVSRESLMKVGIRSLLVVVLSGEATAGVSRESLMKVGIRSLLVVVLSGEATAGVSRESLGMEQRWFKRHSLGQRRG